MTRPAWMPTGNELVRQLIVAGAIAAVAWLLHQQLAKRPAPAAAAPASSS